MVNLMPPAHRWPPAGRRSGQRRISAAGPELRGPASKKLSSEKRTQSKKSCCISGEGVPAGTPAPAAPVWNGEPPARVTARLDHDDISIGQDMATPAWQPVVKRRAVTNAFSKRAIRSRVREDRTRIASPGIQTETRPGPRSRRSSHRRELVPQLFLLRLQVLAGKCRRGHFQGNGLDHRQAVPVEAYELAWIVGEEAHRAHP